MTSVRVTGKSVRHWTDYTVASDMLVPADAFSMTMGPATPEAIALLDLNAEVEIEVEGSVIMSGRVEGADVDIDPGAGATLSISGRDGAARMLDESMPPGTLTGLSVAKFAERCAGPWFESIEVQDAQALGKIGKIELQPSDMRWEVLIRGLKEIGRIAWSTPDGKTLVIGKPDYKQKPSYRFVVPVPGAGRTQIGGVKTARWLRTANDRYSRITVLVEGRGSAASYGRGTAVVATAVSTDPIWDLGSKELVIAGSDAKTLADAKIRVQQEMDMREGKGSRLQLRVKGHGQPLRRGEPPLVYEFGKMCEVELDHISHKGRWLITSCEFSEDTGEGKVTELELVPDGTDLSQ